MSDRYSAEASRAGEKESKRQLNLSGGFAVWKEYETLKLLRLTLMLTLKQKKASGAVVLSVDEAFEAQSFYWLMQRNNNKCLFWVITVLASVVITTLVTSATWLWLVWGRAVVLNSSLLTSVSIRYEKFRESYWLLCTSSLPLYRFLPFLSSSRHMIWYNHMMWY